VDPLLIGGLGFLIMICLILLGLPVWAGMVAVSVVGISFVSGPHLLLGFVGTLPHAIVSSYTLAVVPLFYLMGVLVGEAGIAADTYTTANKWFSGVPGGLAMATTVGSGLFAAASGSSVASALLFTKIALPEMDKYKYPRRLSLGCIASAGTFAAMIPPSTAIVLYSILTGLSTGKCLMAGFFPGILTVFLYLIYIYVRSWWLSRDISPASTTRVTWKEKIVSIKGTWAIVVLFCLVLGGIYLGIFTPSAAAAVGAFGALLIALGKRRITTANLATIGVTTGRGIASIAIIIIGGFFLSRFLILSGFVDSLSDLITGAELSPVIVFGSICLMYLVLGCLMDPLSMMVSTVSFVYPIIITLGFDGVWFGIILIKLTEIGAVTPPIGINLFVVTGAAGEETKASDVMIGALPFICMDMIALVLLFIFPKIALFLPLSMFK
jgi:C4-dicarboxylate transporter DctM subunit